MSLFNLRNLLVIALFVFVGSMGLSLVSCDDNDEMGGDPEMWQGYYLTKGEDGSIVCFAENFTNVTVENMGMGEMRGAAMDFGEDFSQVGVVATSSKRESNVVALTYVNSGATNPGVYYLDDDGNDDGVYTGVWIGIPNSPTDQSDNAAVLCPYVLLRGDIDDPLEDEGGEDRDEPIAVTTCEAGFPSLSRDNCYLLDHDMGSTVDISTVLN